MKNIVSYGGGTQSTALILMALNGEYNLPRPDFGVYADTGGEPEFINEYVRYFIDYVKQKYDFDIFIVKRKGVGLAENLMSEPKTSKQGNTYINSIIPFYVKGMGMLKRSCTSDYKVIPVERFIKSKINKGEKIRQWMGISFDERQRVKISMEKWREYYYPLVDNKVRRIDSIEYVKSQGLKTPQRSSCTFCPFHSNNYWQWLKDYHPNEFQKVVNIENIFRSRKMTGLPNDYFLHKSCKPINEVIFSDPDQLNMFPELIDECGGECGI